jgi:acetylornithine/succinyldiaminopimelate/putrescine aminotransferase
MPNLRQLFLKHLAQTSEFPLMLEIDSAEGIYLYDKNGKSYIDLIAGIGVSSLGHRHPRVVNAAKDQLDKYLHTLVYGEFVLTPQVKLAALLAENLPDPLDSTYFVNSGSEAVEGAMKLAKKYTSRYEIISCHNAYHGSTQGAASLMSDSFFTQAYRPLLPGIRHIEFNNESSLESISEKTACVIVETIQGEGGIQIPEDGFLKKLRMRCDETGALLVLDEIQAGCGRTGYLFAFEQYDVVPDVLLLAKGLGGGMPIGAFIASNEIMKVLSFDPFLGHITTFGGHPVCCAAALATLEELVESDLISKVKQKEKLFRELLVHPKIKEIRSAGLMMAVEFEHFDFAQAVIKDCIENGLITDWFLFNDRSLRIAPPLIIKEYEIKKACSIILNAINNNS